MDKKVNILFYLLVVYIFLQFIWWAYMLIDLNLELFADSSDDVLFKKILMVAGEGLVFFSFLIAGLVITRNAIKKELLLVRQQRNFLLSITHELKTPIAAIKLCLETLSKHSDLSEDKRLGLQNNALSNTSRLNELIENVLLATRIESGEEVIDPRQVNLSTLTHKILERFSGHPKPEIKSFVAAEILANVDPSAYDSILSNLIENALKYGDDNPVQVSLTSDDSFARIKVMDQGLGISSENTNRIFEKFYREQNEETRSQKGTGLGLYIVKRLVTLHNGHLTVTENDPKGSVFTVTLPLN